MVHHNSIRRFFPGSNTPSGFYSFYEYVMPYEKAARIYFIKGGPGTGKSTMMKRLGRDMIKLGHEVEYYHCSADPSSIDAITVNGNIAMIDATFPHALEPKFPGAIDELLDFTAFWDQKALMEKRDAIVRLGHQRRRAFQKAYRYLSAAKDVSDDMTSTMSSMGTIKPSTLQSVLSIIDEAANYQGENQPSPGLPQSRHMFAEAITPDGLVDHMRTIVTPMSRRVVIKGAPGTGTTDIVQVVADGARRRGLFTECFHSTFDPTLIRHVVIPAIDTAFVSASPDDDVQSLSPHTVIDMSPSAGSREDTRAKSDLARARATFDRLFQTAVSALNDAKKMHLELESLYIPHMDFGRLDGVYRRVVQEIQELTAEIR